MRLRTRFPRLSHAALFLTVCLPGALLLSPSSTQAQPLPDRAAFSGQVVAGDGKPLGGASILLRRQNEQSGVAYWGGVAATDARGNFSFPDAEAGLYYLSIDAGGYAPILNQSVTLPLRGEAAPFKLLELATLRLKLTDSTGAPLKEAGFTMLVRGVPGSTDTYPRLSRGTTNASGEISFANLLPGRFDLLGVSSGRGYIENRNVTIAPGVAASVLNWQLSRGGTLQVSAHDSAGKAIGGATILFSRIGEAAPDAPRPAPGPEMQVYALRPLYVTRDGDGLFSVVDLAPGRYSVTLAYPGAPDIPPQIVQVADGTTVTTDFKLAPPAGVAVAVTVMDSKDAPYADRDVLFMLQQVAPGAAVGAAITPAQTAAAGTVMARQDRRAHTDGTGKVVLFPVPAGTYQITVRRSNDATGGSKAMSPAQVVEVKEGVAPLAYKLP